MSEQTWWVTRNEDETVDEVVMRNAYVHFEDLGDAYMLIADNSDYHVHLTIPAHRKNKPWVFEEYAPNEEAAND